VIENRSWLRRRWPVLVVVVALVAAVSAAWILQAGVGDGGASAKNGSAPYSISVEKGGAVLKTYDLAALHALPQASVEIDGKKQDGPLLTTLLDDAAVGTYHKVAVRGAGIRDPGHLDLTATEAAHDVQLDYSDRGTVKVCSPWLERREWVRDVLTISAD